MGLLLCAEASIRLTAQLHTSSSTWGVSTNEPASRSTAHRSPPYTLCSESEAKRLVQALEMVPNPLATQKMAEAHLDRKLLMKPITWKLGKKESVPASRCASTSGKRSRCCWLCSRLHSSWRSVKGTGLGIAVEPDVNMMSARSSGCAMESACKNDALGEVRLRAGSTSLAA